MVQGGLGPRPVDPDHDQARGRLRSDIGDVENVRIDFIVEGPKARIGDDPGVDHVQDVVRVNIR
jgi:hypothetical protein